MPLGRETVGDVWVRVHADGTGLNREVKDEFTDLNPVYQEFGEENSEYYKKGWDKGFDKFLKENQRKFANQNRGFRSALTKLTKQSNATWKEAEKGLLRYANQIGTTRRVIDEVTEAIDKAADHSDRLLARRTPLWRLLSDEVYKAGLRIKDFGTRLSGVASRGLDRFERGAKRVESGLGRLNSRLDDFAEGIDERSRRSRNDFVYFFQRMVASSIRLGTLLPKVAEGLSSIFSGGGGGGPDFTKISQAFSSLAANAAGFAVVLVVITALAAPLAAALSGLAAALIAVAGSAAFALAALGGVALMLGGTLVGAVAVGILAFKNLDQATKDSFDSIGDRFDELGKSAGEAIGPPLRRAAAILDETLANPKIERLIDGVARAIGRVAESFAEITETRAFRQFVDAMTRFLPGAVESLGDSFANLGTGFMGVFRALIPITQQFLGWFEKITGQFAVWANSREGQETLKNFFEKAADSARQVWDLIVQVGKALGELFSAGRESGDTILQDMADQVRSLVEWLQDPKNQKAIQDFFKNGVEVARGFGRVVARLIELFDALDGPRSRKAFQFLIDVITKIIQFWTGGVRVWSRIIGTMVNLAQTSASKISGFFSAAKDKIVGFFKAIPGALSSVWESIKNAARNASDAVLDFFRDLPGEIVDFFSGLGSRIVSAIGNIDIDINWPDPPGWVSKIPGLAAGAVVNGPTRALIGEAGPEAVVPLNRPLAMVDPSVRALSAFAQGIPFANGGIAGTPQKVLNVGPITVNTPTTDPRAVAVETINRLALVGGF